MSEHNLPVAEKAKHAEMGVGEVEWKRQSPRYAGIQRARAFLESLGVNGKDVQLRTVRSQIMRTG